MLENNIDNERLNLMVKWYKISPKEDLFELVFHETIGKIINLLQKELKDRKKNKSLLSKPFTTQILLSKMIEILLKTLSDNNEEQSLQSICINEILDTPESLKIILFHFFEDFIELSYIVLEIIFVISYYSEYAHDSILDALEEL